MKTAYTLTVLALPALAILAFSPQTAEASFAITYSSGDWSSHGHKYRRKDHSRYKDRYVRKDRYRDDFAHRKYYRKNYAYAYPRYYRPYYYGTTLNRLYDLPRGATFVWINGDKYYTYRGTYYRRSDCGTYYTVVDDPHSVPVAAKQEIGHYYQDTVYESNQKEFVVHIRDRDGKLVTVRLTKEEDGYVGPQGEFYPEFPKVAQLREMYVK